MKRIYVILILFAVANFGFAATYYVSDTGDNNNNGLSINQAWSSIQYAVDEVVAGDIIEVLDGTYNELITFNTSGNSVDGHIVLMNHSGHSPIIDATGLANNGGDMPAIIKIEDTDYIKVIGFELKNLITASSSKFPAGIWVLGDAHHIEIANNIIHNIQHTNEEGAHGIGIYGTKSTEAIHDIAVLNNEIMDCTLAWSEALVLNGNVTDFKVNFNEVHDNDNIGIDFIGHEGTCPDPDLDQTRDGECIGNLVYNIDSRNNPVYQGEASAGGIYVDGGKNIIVDRNEIYACNLGIEIASEWMNQSTSEITVRNNFIYDCHVVGFAMGGYDADRGESNNCSIVNNTLYNNDTDDVGWGSELLIQYYCNDNIVKNNIIFAKEDGKLMDYGINSGSNNVFDNNIYYNSGQVTLSWNGTYYDSFSDFASGSGQEDNGAFENPNLNDPNNGDLRLSSSSATAINNGESLDNDIVGDVDFDGNNRVIYDNIDIGAHEYIDPSDIHIQVLADIIEIYPNPFSDIVLVDGNFEDYVITILDATGSEVMTLEELQPPVTINLSDLGSGTYFIQIQNINAPSHFVEKIIKL